MIKTPSLVRLIFSILFLIISVGSNAQEVTADYDGRVDFQKFKTYSWLAPGDSVLNRYRSEKVFAGSITAAADNELKNRGMKIDSLRPDAIFVFDTMVKDITVYTQGATLSVGVAVAGPGYYVGGSAPVAGGKITESTEEGGTLLYAMYDTSDRRLVWSGRAEKKFEMSDDIHKIINDYTVKIFKKLPIKPIKKK